MKIELVGENARVTGNVEHVNIYSWKTSRGYRKRKRGEHPLNGFDLMKTKSVTWRPESLPLNNFPRKW